MKPEKNDHRARDRPRLVFESYFIGVNSAALQHPGKKRLRDTLITAQDTRRSIAQDAIIGMDSWALFRYADNTRDFVCVISNVEERINGINSGWFSLTCSI